MKKLLTVVLVLLAIPVMAQDESKGLPLTYVCQAAEGVRIEEDFCDLLLMSVLRTDLFQIAKPGDKKSLNMIVLPLQDSSDTDRMATSIVMSITLPSDPNENILAYHFLNILNSDDVHDDETLDQIVSICIDGVTEWLIKHVGISPGSEVAAFLDGSNT